MADAGVASLLAQQDAETTTRLDLRGVGLTSLESVLPQLSALTQLTELSLRDNQLSALPADLSALQALRVIDLRGNDSLRECDDADAMTRVLVTMPSLQLAVLPAMQEDVLAAVAAALPSHVRVVDANMVPAEMDEGGAGAASGSGAPMTQQEADAADDLLTQPAEVVNALSVLYSSILGAESDASMDEFNMHVSSVLQTLQERDALDRDPHCKQADRLTAKFAMYELCFQALAQKVDPALAEHVLQLGITVRSMVTGLGEIPDRMKAHYEQRMSQMQEELDRAERDTAELLQAAELLEKETQVYVEDKKQMMAEFERTKAELLEGMGWLKAENDKLHHRIRQLEARAKPSQAPQSPLQLAPSGATPRSASRGPAGAGPTAAAAGAGSASGTPSAPGSGASAAAAAGGRVVQRDLSLAKTKDIIEEIYAAKQKFDEKCAESRLPRETMEQFLLTFLNQKYGLKNLIVEWATSIVAAVKRFQSIDNDVAVFGKILRNEFDEEFRFVQKQLKETVAELLRVYLKGKNPLKSDADILEMLKRRLAGHVLEEEWVDIIKYMYNRDDGVALIVRVKEVIKQRALEHERQQAATSLRDRRRAASADDSVASGRILYTDLLQVLLDYQMRGHERFLSKFVRLFRDHDGDADGVLTEDEFRTLVLSIDPAKQEDEIVKLLESADPYNNQRINFSDCVGFLARELVSMSASQSRVHQPSRTSASPAPGSAAAAAAAGAASAQPAAAGSSD